MIFLVKQRQLMLVVPLAGVFPMQCQIAKLFKEGGGAGAKVRS